MLMEKKSQVKLRAQRYSERGRAVSYRSREASLSTKFSNGKKGNSSLFIENINNQFCLYP